MEIFIIGISSFLIVVIIIRVMRGKGLKGGGDGYSFDSGASANIDIARLFTIGSSSDGDSSGGDCGDDGD